MSTIYDYLLYPENCKCLRVTNLELIHNNCDVSPVVRRILLQFKGGGLILIVWTRRQLDNTRSNNISRNLLDPQRPYLRQTWENCMNKLRQHLNKSLG